MNALYAPDDPKLEEYMAAMRPRIAQGQRTWANDDVIASMTEGVSHYGVQSTRRVKAKVTAVKNRKTGGDGLLLAKSHVTFEDDSDQEYSDMPTKPLVEEDDEEVEQQEQEQVKDLQQEAIIQETANVVEMHPSRMAMLNPDATFSSKPQESNSCTKHQPLPCSNPLPKPVIETVDATEQQQQSPVVLISDTGRLYVKNLSYLCTSDDLHALFEPFGPISEVHIPIHKGTKGSKGYAFILFLLPEHAIKVIKRLISRHTLHWMVIFSKAGVG